MAICYPQMLAKKVDNYFFGKDITKWSKKNFLRHGAKL